MTDVVLPPSALADEAPRSAVSWGAIIAGAVAASAISLILIVLGAGIGLSAVSPWSASGASAGTVGMIALAWSLAVPLFSYAVGGYLAGRLRTTWVGAHTDEVYFRDTAHGMLVWALGTIVSMTLVASVLSSIVSGTAQLGATVAGGAGSAIASAAGSAAKDVDLNAYFNDMLFRSQQSQQSSPGDATAARAEVGRIFARSLTAGEIAPQDKDYVVQTISRQTGLSAADAQKRVDDVVSQAKSAAQQASDKAKAAADAARKAGVYAALWLFVSLLLGGLSASYLATVGGRLRDDMPAMG